MREQRRLWSVSESAALTVSNSALFWMDMIKSYTVDNESFDNDDELEMANVIKDCFCIELLEHVLDNIKDPVDDIIVDLISIAYPMRLFKGIATNSANQSFKQQMTELTDHYFYKRFANLPQPFDDERFSVYPIQSLESKGGYAFEESLQGLLGGLIKAEIDGETIFHRNKTAHNSFHMDAQLGLMFYFQNKPSFMVCFNVDAKGAIYVNQIQSQHKDRGNYKLGQNWREKALEYVSKCFNESEVHLISGQYAADTIFNGYAPNHPLINDLTLKSRIKAAYDSMFKNTFSLAVNTIGEYRKVI